MTAATRAHAILRLLALDPLEIECLLNIMGGDRDETKSSLNTLLGEHRVYCSRGWYHLNPRARRDLTAERSRLQAANQSGPFIGLVAQ